MSYEKEIKEMEKQASCIARQIREYRIKQVFAQLASMKNKNKKILDLELRLQSYYKLIKIATVTVDDLLDEVEANLE